MIEAGIYPDDLLVVDRSLNSKDGDIVIAILDGDLTVKELRIRDGRVALVPRNRTMKPIPLLAYPISNSTMTNCTVLDPFGGSGSTLIACEQTDRICYMIELDEKFCDVIIKRYIEQVGSDKEVTVERDGQTLPFNQVKIDAK